MEYVKQVEKLNEELQRKLSAALTENDELRRKEEIRIPSWWEAVLPVYANTKRTNKDKEYTFADLVSVYAVVTYDKDSKMWSVDLNFMGYGAMSSYKTLAAAKKYVEKTHDELIESRLKPVIRK